jgi:hypothetical protein
MALEQMTLTTCYMYCTECLDGEQMELVRWGWDIKQKSDYYGENDIPNPLFVRFVWECQKCESRVVKTASLGYVVCE